MCPSCVSCTVLAGRVVCSKAVAFSGPGQEFVGALAENILVEKSKSSDSVEAARASTALKKARALLKTSFAEASTIADEIKELDPKRDDTPATVTTRRQAVAAAHKWPSALVPEILNYHDRNADSKSPHYHHKVHFADIAIAGTSPLKYDPNALGAEPFDIV